ncbi:hypothetical protein QFZ75_008058 [Streptomyces sp. V3I8]|uniref:hypothetical protein n=1 Tax=Streptomyces sp. V3I8 TaxID=3042279 RepID=UPI00277F2B75|nr:hypothetical protein [Streptomyces sp. V3I8]MDQ1041556.1 hypothetical protein [Streptomyces sp. V3I8]
MRRAPRFLAGLALAALAFWGSHLLNAPVEMSVFLAAIVAIGVWFRGFELIMEGIGALLLWVLTGSWS